MHTSKATNLTESLGLDLLAQSLGRLFWVHMQYLPASQKFHAGLKCKGWHSFSARCLTSAKTRRRSQGKPRGRDVAMGAPIRKIVHPINLLRHPRRFKYRWFGDARGPLVRLCDRRTGY